MSVPSAGLAPATEEALARLAGRLSGEGRIVIGAHVDPDGDAIGSMCALALSLTHAGIEVYASLADDVEPPRTYRGCPGLDLLRPPSEAPRWPVVVGLDLPAVSRFGALAPVAKDASLLIRVDHHPFGERFSDVDVVDPDAPATAYLVWRLLTLMELPRSLDVLEALWVGLVTDTGRFQYSNASPAAFAMACDLVKQGVRPEKVFRYVYDNRRMAALRLEALAIERAQMLLGGRLIWAALDDKDLSGLGAVPEETENLIDVLRSVEGTEVALFLKVRPDGLRGSLRSKGAVDVSFVARAMGGGGHREAAGFPCDGTVEEAVSTVERLVAAALERPG